jgi:hypothetical protein
LRAAARTEASDAHEPTADDEVEGSYRKAGRRAPRNRAAPWKDEVEHEAPEDRNAKMHGDGGRD